jgi:hypothetical protein
VEYENNGYPRESIRFTLSLSPEVANILFTDVFLTPLKPLQKIVTASDVENCLYYLHAHTPKDESLISPPDIEVPQPVREPFQEPVWDPPVSSASDSARSSGVKRKALPAMPSERSTQDANSSNPHPLPPAPPYPEEDRNWFNPRGPSQLPFRTSQSPPIASQHPPYPNNENWPKANPAPYPNNNDSYRSRAHSAPYAQPSTSHSTQVNTKYQSFSEDNDRPPLPPRRSSSSLQYENQSRSTQAVTQLTLIRRHPATGEQWNVADITDPPVYEVETNTTQQTRKPGQPLYIDVETAGYSKFVQGQNAFTRRLWMEGSIFESWLSDHRKSHSSESLNSSPYPEQPGRESMNSNDGSYDVTMNPTLLQRDPVMHRLSIDNTKKRSKTRGYTFTSPWNGRCEFAPANGGTSLKCRHALPSTGLAAAPSAPTTVSELRFNLPSASGTATSGRPKSSSSSRKSIFHLHSHRKSIGSEAGSTSSLALPQTQHRRGQSDTGPGEYLNHQRSNDPQRQSYDNGNDSRLDLSLGQELAGGGFGGKQVKLGKLIVEFEGLKMLDLVVAANMALWWRAYEKTL